MSETTAKEIGRIRSRIGLSTVSNGICVSTSHCESGIGEPPRALDRPSRSLPWIKPLFPFSAPMAMASRLSRFKRTREPVLPWEFRLPG